MVFKCSAWHDVSERENRKSFLRASWDAFGATPVSEVVKVGNLPVWRHLAALAIDKALKRGPVLAHYSKVAVVLVATVRPSELAKRGPSAANPGRLAKASCPLQTEDRPRGARGWWGGGAHSQFATSG